MVCDTGDNSILVTLSAHEFLPGDSIDVSVDIGGGPSDEKLQAVRVELGYVNTYRHLHRRANGRGSHERETSDTVTVDTRELPVEQSGIGIGSRRFEATVTLPPSAPPSLLGYVRWHVKAVLDRRRALDRDEAVPISVLAPAGANAAWVQAEQVSEGDCEMSLAIPAHVVCVGETLSGVLHLDPKTSFDVRAIRVELECLIEHHDNIEKTLSEEEISVAGATELKPGSPLALPFEIAPPADGAPTLRAAHNKVRWHLKGVCDRKLHRDASVTAELDVYNAPAERARRTDPAPPQP